LFFLGFGLMSQSVYTFADSLNVIVEGKTLKNPFTGGFNSCQFGNFDLDNDGIKDLVVFERSTNKLLPFLSQNSQLVYAPVYESQFPKCNGFFLLRDYNLDGIEDIFTYSSLGITVYEGIRIQNDFFFRLVKKPVFSKAFGNIFNILTNVNDVPIVDDIDGDKDLDVVLFSFANGSYLQFHQNQSMERYRHADSLVFEQKDECFAGIKEVSCDSFVFNLNCKMYRIAPNARTQHVGAGALLFFDVDGDNLKDLILSKEDCNTLKYFKNKSKSGIPDFEQRFYKFSPSSVFAQISFPAAFAADVNSDGKSEFLASYGSASSGYNLDFENAVYLFDGNLKLSQSNFLQNESIDLGENASPTLFDIDGDGDQDLLVGYHTNKKNNLYRGALAYFENIPVDSQAVYLLRDRDYMALQARQWVNVIPQFFDIDTDGNIDLLVTASAPLSFLATNSYVFYGDKPQYFHFSQKIDTLTLPLNIEDVPLFTRFKNDTQVKALVGKNSGKLNLYQLVAGNWEMQNADFGFVPDEFSKQCTVAEANIDGDTLADLLLSNSTGSLLWVKNYQTAGSQNWVIDTIRHLAPNQTDLKALRLSSRNVLFSQFDKKQKSDILVGCRSGGVLLLKESNQKVKKSNLLDLFPNPFSSQFFVKTKAAGPYHLYDLSGKLLKSGYLQSGLNLLEMNLLAKGVYLFKTIEASVKLFKD
jgi:hypothetical protein